MSNNNLGGIPDLGERTKTAGINKLFFYGGGFIGLLFIVVFGMIFMSKVNDQREQEKAASAKEINKETAEATQKKDFAADRHEIEVADKEQKSKDAAIQAELNAKGRANVAPSNANYAADSGQAAVPRPYTGSVLVSNGGATLGGNDQRSAPASTGSTGIGTNARASGPNGNIATAPFSATTGSGGDKLSDRLTPSVLANTSAKLREDLSMLLRKGTMIPCVQQSAIVTNYPSMILCRTTKDIYSANGKVLLIERGSTVIGEQRTGLQRGQKTIFVIWSSIETDKGVSIQIDSPGTNAIGAGGIDAYIDNHWMERFSNSILLTLIGDTLEGVKNYYSQRPGSNGSTQFYPAQTQAATQNMATEALKNSINIPPTGYSNQGSLLNIFVARDVDFRNVYALRPVSSHE